jgi:hypothetical protein
MRPLLLILLVLTAAAAAAAQVSKADPGPIRSSAAYAEVLLRKTELLAEAESLSDSYTEDAPKMIDLRYEVASLDKALAKLLTVKPADTGRLTLALGKLLVRRASFDTDLNRLSRTYNPDYPDVKKTKKRLEIFDAAIREILP